MSEPLAWIGGSFLACLFVDFALSRLSLVKEEKARWYLIHALVNTVVVILVAPDVVALLQDPLSGLDGKYTDAPLAATVGLHIFHCATQSSRLTSIDWAHHLVSNMLVSALVFPFRWGPLVSWGTLFVCGLPGGVDYYLLFLVKVNAVSKQSEKDCNRFLNVWIRAPGILAFPPIAYCCWASGRYHAPGWLLVVQSLLNGFNALYFADRVVANAAVSRDRLERAASEKAH